jgi:hypothetical protein
MSLIPLRLTRALPLLLLLAAPAAADSVTDALQAALEAYAAGDLDAAATSVASAGSAIGALQSEKLAAFLPEAPEGWTREMTTDFAAGLAIMGGGSGTEMRYISPEGSSFTITVMADNPMVTGMMGLFMNDEMLASMGTVTEVDGARLIDDGSGLMAVIGQTMMVQASGMDSATMLPIVSAVDFRGLADLAD